MNEEGRLILRLAVGLYLVYCDYALVRYFKERKARQEKKDVPSEEEP